MQAENLIWKLIKTSLVNISILSRKDKKSFLIVLGGQYNFAKKILILSRNLSFL